MYWRGQPAACTAPPIGQDQRHDCGAGRARRQRCEALSLANTASRRATGLVDMGARDYGPSTGTFSAADTVIGTPLAPVTFNRYLYGGGDPVDAFDPNGQWSLFGTISDLWNTFTSFVSDPLSALGQFGQDLSQVASSVAQTITSAATHAYDIAKAVATDAVHAVSQVAHNLSSNLGATVASIAVGGLVFVGCEAVTAGVGSVGCLAAAGAAGGAIYGAMTCPSGNSTLKCAGVGAIAGAAAGATAGIGGELGLGVIGSGALAGASGNATSQLLTTGHINPTQVGVSALEGGLFGGAAKLLGPRLGATDPSFADPNTPAGETTTPADGATPTADTATASTSQESAALTGNAQDLTTTTRTSQDTAVLGAPEHPIDPSQATSAAYAAAGADSSLPDSMIIARGGERPIEPPGMVFSGSQGQTIGEAGQGLVHGQFRWTTAGDIRVGGGTVEPLPELNPRVGRINYQHVNICLGEGPCQWTDLIPNVAKNLRFGGKDYPFYEGYLGWGP